MPNQAIDKDGFSPANIQNEALVIKTRIVPKSGEF